MLDAMFVNISKIIAENKEMVAIVVSLCAFIHTFWRSSADCKWRSAVEKVEITSNLASENVKKMWFILERSTRGLPREEPETLEYYDKHGGSRVTTQGSSKYTRGAVILQQAMLDKSNSADQENIRRGVWDFVSGLRRMKESRKAGVISRDDINGMFDAETLDVFITLNLCSYFLSKQEAGGIFPMSREQMNDLAALVQRATSKETTVLYSRRRIKVESVSELPR